MMNQIKNKSENQ